MQEEGQEVEQERHPNQDRGFKAILRRFWQPNNGAERGQLKAAGGGICATDAPMLEALRGQCSKRSKKR